MYIYRLVCFSVGIGCLFGLLGLEAFSGRWWASMIGMCAMFQAFVPDDRGRQ